MLLLASFSLFLPLQYAVGQSTHTVSVGVEGSFYDPPTTDALEGDVVHFVFGGLIHDVTQSSFDAPCLPLPGGFSSGFAGVNGSTTFFPPVWDLKVTNVSETIWFMCQATEPQSHCQAGMVGAINPPSADMFTSFQNAAKVPTTTPAPTVSVALTGLGAFAAAPPTSSPLPSGSTLTLPGTTGFLPEPSSVTTSAPTPTQSQSHSSNVAVIAGAAGGGAAVIIIAILSFLLYRSKRSKKPKSFGFNQDMTDRNLLAEPSYPTATAFSRATMPAAYPTYNDKYRGQSPPIHRPASPMDIRGGRPALDQASSEPSQEDNQPELRYANSRNDLRSLTLADAMYAAPHPYAHAETTRSPERQVAPEVNVHELAKEVAALIRPQPVPATNATFVQVPSNMLARGRTARQLPNPAGSPTDNESVLPRYER